MKSRLGSLVLIFSFLAGCASQIMEGYVGKSISEPMLDYGPPTSVIDLPDGTRGYQWSISSTGVTPIATPTTTTVYGSGGYAVATGSETTYLPWDQTCLYTLLAAQSGNDWVVTGYRQPSLMCE